MNYKPLIFLISLLFSLTSIAEEGKHLFLLSGQSNMKRFQHSQFFVPAMEKEYGAENVIFVKVAEGGQPISRWYKNWQSSKGETPKTTGDLYNQLMTQTKEAIKGQNITSVTFIWMQGERDAKDKNSDVYAASLKGLKAQLEEDLNRQDINFIIGRLSDSGIKRKKVNSDWDAIRKIQVAFAEQSPRAAWIDTDDLNGKKDAVHYEKPEGYKKMGERYVAAAIKLISDSE